MTLTNQQWKARLSIRSDKIKWVIKESIQKECIKYGIAYNESDTNAQLCEKINNR